MTELQGCNLSLAKAFFQRCAYYYYEEEYAKALWDIRDTIKYYPKCNGLEGEYPHISEVHATLGSIQYKLKHYEESIESYTKALELSSDYHSILDYYKDRSKVYKKMKKDDMAELDMELADKIQSVLYEDQQEKIGKEIDRIIKSREKLGY